MKKQTKYKELESQTRVLSYYNLPIYNKRRLFWKIFFYESALNLRSSFMCNSLILQKIYFSLICAA